MVTYPIITGILICFLTYSFYFTISLLPTIGEIRWRAFRGQKPLNEQQKAKYLDIPYNFISLLAGIIDGDGYIAVTRTTKGYIEILLIISLDHNDRGLLEYIQNILGFGRINGPYYNKDGTVTSKLIFTRVDLQERLFPLFVYHGIFFLTDIRRKQLNLALFVVTNNILKYDDISSQIPFSPFLPLLPILPEEYLGLKFFRSWVVGFTIAEGSFFTKTKDNSAWYSLKQRFEPELFEALKLLFKTKSSIGLYQGKYHSLSLSSKDDIQNVVNLFSFSPGVVHPLIGQKALQYENWIEGLKRNPRYKSLQLPSY